VAALKLAWQGDLGPKGKSASVLSVIAVLGAIYAIWTIFGAGLEAIYWGIGLLLAGVPVYVAMKMLRRSPS
jgi:APA family basic amino acid/polyamine antiporter